PGRGLDGAGDADQQQRRTHHGPASARGTGGVRARLFDRADQPFLREHLPNGGIRRHGALGAASEDESAGCGLIALPSGGVTAFAWEIWSLFRAFTENCAAVWPNCRLNRLA